MGLFFVGMVVKWMGMGQHGADFHCCITLYF